MHDRENVLPFAAPMPQLAATFKTMYVSVNDSEMAMALLNLLPLHFDSPISALDAAHNDDTKFNFKSVQSRCVQEKRRKAQRVQEDLESSEVAAFLAKSSPRSKRIISTDTCISCGKHNNSAKCTNSSLTWTRTDTPLALILIKPPFLSERPL